MNRPAVRFVLIFIAWLALLFGFLETPPGRALVVEPATSLVARASSLLLAASGVPNELRGTRIETPAGFSAQIIEACNGLDVLAIVAAATLAFPGGWRVRLIGLLAAIPVVQGLNLVRIVSLCWLGSRGSSLYDAFHLYVWQTALLLASLGLWILWAERIAMGPARASATAPPSPSAGPSR